MFTEKEKQPLACFYELMNSYIIGEGEILPSELDLNI